MKVGAPSRISPFRFLAGKVYQQDLKEVLELLNWAAAESSIELLAGGVVGPQGWETSGGDAPAVQRINLSDSPAATWAERFSTEILVPADAIELVPWVRLAVPFNDLGSVRFMVDGVERSLGNFLDPGYELVLCPPISIDTIGAGERHLSVEFYRNITVTGAISVLSWGIYVARMEAADLRDPSP